MTYLALRSSALHSFRSQVVRAGSSPTSDTRAHVAMCIAIR